MKSFERKFQEDLLSLPSPPPEKDEVTALEINQSMNEVCKNVLLKTDH